MEKLRLIKCWKTMLLLLCMSMISGTIFAQDITLRGHVTDQKGEPLIGATVKVVGTTNGGTVTDISGNFALRTGSNTSALNVSYVGYVALNVPVKAGTTNLGNIILASDANNLNEVVVVGYGTLKKQDVTGTVATVDHKSLQEIPATNVFDQLKGKVAGVEVVNGNNGPAILIRGNRTIGSTGQDGPLIILDGVPFRNSIENINPNDIKSVDVLKGASATAIYGSRGSGGVLLITTNRGRIGQTQTSYDSYYGIQALEGKLNVLDANGYIQLKKDVLQGAVLQGLQGTTDPNSLTATENAGIAAGTNTDWVKLLIKNGMVTDHSLRVSGGTDKTQFNVGMGYNLNTGLEKGNQNQRITLNTSIDTKLNNLLKVGVSIQNSLRITDASGGNNYGTAQWFSPLVSAYNADGTINVAPLVGSQDANTANPLLQGSLPNAYYNHTRGFVTNDIVYAELTPVEHLKYRYQVGYSYSQSLQGTYNGINGANIVTIAKTTASTNNNSFYGLTQEHTLSYDNTFGKHHINFVGGFTVETQHTENSGANVTGIPSDANLNSNLGLGTFNAFQNNAWNETGLLSYLGRINYAFSNKYDVTATMRADGNSVLAQGHQWTSYPSIGLGWVISNEPFMQKYTFVDNLKLRAGYGETSAITGSPYQTLGPLSSSTYQYGGASAGDASGVRVSTLVNNLLTWQRTKEFNLALDFSILKGRLTGSVEGYAQNTLGVILNNFLPPTNGSPNQNSNLGNSSNRGIELTLSSVNIRNKGGFTWTSDFNIGFNRERIDYLPNGAPANIGAGEFVGQPLNVIYDLKKIGIWQISDSPGIDATKTAQAGGAANGQAVYQPIAGLTPAQYPGQIRVQDLNGDGKIDANDNQVIGHFNPNYTFGFTNRFTYKSFDLSIVIQARMGFTTIVPYISSSNSNAQGWQFLNIGRHNQPVIPYWTPANPGGTFPEPNFTQGNYYSTLQYYDGSFIRAKSINLGYNVPSTLLKHVGISSLRLYANVSNPFFIYAPVRNNGFSVPDAESTSGVTINAFSANGSAPRPVGLNAGEQARTFIFGINARF